MTARGQDDRSSEDDVAEPYVKIDETKEIRQYLYLLIDLGRSLPD